MITINEKTEVNVEELVGPSIKKGAIKAKRVTRPMVLNAKVYKLKSSFVDYAIYVTLTYIEDEDGKKKPFEIFINSKDLTKSAEYAVLTRLISAIFRRSEDPTFILDELKSIYDPNGGYFKDGKYVASIYAEIADVLEKFFIDIGLLKKKTAGKQTTLFFQFKSDNHVNEIKPSKGIKDRKDTKADNVNLSLKICPKCGQRTLKVEGGCMTCINPECNYSKCD